MKELCAELNEPKQALMRRAVDQMGLSVVRSLAAEVSVIEAKGGQMTAAGDRRRTPGGVFWRLLRKVRTLLLFVFL